MSEIGGQKSLSVEGPTVFVWESIEKPKSRTDVRHTALAVCHDFFNAHLVRSKYFTWDNSMRSYCADGIWRVILNIGDILPVHILHMSIGTSFDFL